VLGPCGHQTAIRIGRYEAFRWRNGQLRELLPQAWRSGVVERLFDVDIPLPNPDFQFWIKDDDLDVVEGPAHALQILPDIVFQLFRTGNIKGIELRELVESIVELLRFKRIACDDEDSASPFFGTGSLGDIDPQPLYRIRPFPGIDNYRVDERTVLIPRSGQMHGVVGTAVQPIGAVLGSAVTEDAIRVNSATPELAGYLFLALRSECSRRQLRARAFGNSALRLDAANVGNILLPDLPRSKLARFGQQACRIAHRRTTAVNREREARNLVESALESHA